MAEAITIERQLTTPIPSTTRRKSGSRNSKLKTIGEKELHHLLVRSVKELGYDMSVFHLRWMPGEYLDHETLQSVPMFWFKKFGWNKEDIVLLFKAGHLDVTPRKQSEMTHVFGTGKRKSKKRISRDPLPLVEPDQSKKQKTVNTDDIYTRTRRLLKKVNPVPCKVRLVDNKSSLSIKSQGFPDLHFLTSQGTQSSATNLLSNTGTEAQRSTKASVPTNLDGVVEELHKTDLCEISEDEETDDDNISVSLSMTTSPKMGTHEFIPRNSLSTPHGDIDINTLMDVRAKHRRTSSLMKRQLKDFRMKNYGEIVWNRLAVQSGRGDTLSRRQFDIELQNNEIYGDPDICKALFETIQSENPVHKKQINKGDVDRVCTELDKIPLVDEISADHLKDEAMKPWIVLKQVFVHIAQSATFDISSYLLVTLTTADLNDVDTVLEYIGSREKEWTSRLRILEWITANLETSVELRPLTNDDNIGPFLLGWMCQCLDERSNLAKGALEMFPNVLSIAMTQTGEAFQFLNDIFSSLFLVLRNKRSKDLTQTANECIVQTVDMIMDWHEHGELDNEVLLEICCIFRDNTNAKEQKHDKVRERCVAYFGFILYGILNEQAMEDPNHTLKTPDCSVVSTPLSPDSSANSPLTPANDAPKSHLISKSADYANEEEKWTPAPRRSFMGNWSASKISKVMKRKYLLDDGNEQFIEYVNESINNGLKDKDPEARNTAFKLMMKLEKETDRKILEDVLDIDAFAMSKFEKWKERKQRGKKKSSKKSRRGIIRRKKSSKKERNLSTGITINADGITIHNVNDVDASNE